MPSTPNRKSHPPLAVEAAGSPASNSSRLSVPRLRRLFDRPSSKDNSPQPGSSKGYSSSVSVPRADDRLIVRHANPITGVLSDHEDEMAQDTDGCMSSKHIETENDTPKKKSFRGPLELTRTVTRRGTGSVNASITAASEENTKMEPTPVVVERPDELQRMPSLSRKDLVRVRDYEQEMMMGSGRGFRQGGWIEDGSNTTTGGRGGEPAPRIPPTALSTVEGSDSGSGSGRYDSSTSVRRILLDHGLGGGEEGGSGSREAVTPVRGVPAAPPLASPARPALHRRNTGNRPPFDGAALVARARRRKSTASQSAGAEARKAIIGTLKLRNEETVEPDRQYNGAQQQNQEQEQEQEQGDDTPQQGPRQLQLPLRPTDQLVNQHSYNGKDATPTEQNAMPRRHSYLPPITHGQPITHARDAPPYPSHYGPAYSPTGYIEQGGLAGNSQEHIPSGTSQDRLAQQRSGSYLYGTEGSGYRSRLSSIDMRSEFGDEVIQGNYPNFALPMQDRIFRDPRRLNGPSTSTDARTASTTEATSQSNGYEAPRRRLQIDQGHDRRHDGEATHGVSSTGGSVYTGAELTRNDSYRRQSTTGDAPKEIHHFHYFIPIGSREYVRGEEAGADDGGEREHVFQLPSVPAGLDYALDLMVHIHVVRAEETEG
ncbi:hypothetical protein BJ508DRAFT_371741 [Ascobolus immersus RN42]|uniref:Uncharacterized protein n=1 Tax=Ascobolus immersus RN42 TaxID=1160509 RepID=A0A3N4IT23_ASCIM|nr:hypothetical protein BJ508DRAFT_371741 [Ascobolus immersus RN42]